MAKPFVIITATDPFDPVVGASFIARKSMAEVHVPLIDACEQNNMRPFVFITNEHTADSVNYAYERGIVTKVTNAYESAFPLFNMLLSALGENGLAETQAVFFDDAMSFEVDVFVECWRRVYPMVPLPPFFGMIHATDRGGYAQHSVLNWHQEQVRKLALFKELFAHSDTAADSLRDLGVKNIRVIAPYYALEEKGKTRRLNTDDDTFKVNWMYSFSHVDQYDKYILLVKQLNGIVQEHISLAGKGESMVDWHPERFSPHLYSRELPEGVAMPTGFKPGSFAQGVHHDFDLLETAANWPDHDSITVSFKPNAEVDYRLLKLAEQGFMVMAPDSGIYRETLDPICTYPVAWLEGYTSEVPEKVTMRIAQEFYDRMVMLKQSWRERHNRKNVMSGESSAFLRRVVRRNVEIGPDIVADRIMTHLGIAY